MNVHAILGGPQGIIVEEGRVFGHVCLLIGSSKIGHHLLFDGIIQSAPLGRVGLAHPPPRTLKASPGVSSVPPRTSDCPLQQSGIQRKDRSFPRLLGMPETVYGVLDGKCFDGRLGIHGICESGS